MLSFKIFFGRDGKKCRALDHVQNAPQGKRDTVREKIAQSFIFNEAQTLKSGSFLGCELPSRETRLNVKTSSSFRAKAFIEKEIEEACGLGGLSVK